MAASGMGGRYGPTTTMNTTDQPPTYTPEKWVDWTSIQYESIKLVGQSKDTLTQEMGQPDFTVPDGKDTRYHYSERLSGLQGAVWVDDDFVVAPDGTILKYFLTAQ
jgi:hypothetical protein